MIGTIDVCLNAHNPNFPLEPVFTFVNSSQSFRIRNVPKKIGKWSITNVTVNVSYPDNTIVSKECVLTGGVWVATVNGCSTSGTCENGFVVTASGIDENEQVVSNYVLGVGNLYVKELDGTITPGTTAVKMYFYETVPNAPHKGDTTFQNGILKVYDGTNWKPCYEQDLSQYYTKTETNTLLNEKANVSALQSYREKTDMTVDLGTTYASWFLSKLYVSLDPPIELKWTTFVWNGIGEETGWMATTANGGDYYGLIPSLEMLFWFSKEQDGSYTAGYGEEITLSQDELSIAAINGDPNNITCTRQSKDPIQVTTSLATESFVNGIVGNINTVLDAINGEVI